MSVKNGSVAISSIGTGLAVAAGAALVPSPASAGDLSLKAAPVSPAWSWTGLYAGAHAGAAWQSAQTHGSYTGVTSNVTTNSFPVSNTLTKSGFLGGGQIGYNWQFGQAVYGLEADYSWLSSNGQSLQQPVGKTVATTTSQIDWLATFRGRMGVAFGNVMPYVTAGLAVGKVKNSFGYRKEGSNYLWAQNETKAGFAVGGGVEHMLAKNWTLRVEGLFVDLGRSTVSGVSGNTGSKTTTFSNQAIIGRAALNYKF